MMLNYQQAPSVTLSITQKLRSLVGGSSANDLIEPLLKQGVWPRGGLARYVCQGIPQDVLEVIGAGIGSAEDWENRFSEAARRYRAMGDKQRDMDPLLANRYYFVSAACAFHAQLVRRGDEKREAALRYQCRKAFELGAEMLRPPMRRFQLEHAGKYLQGYYRAAPHGARGTVILLNSQQSCKEDMFYFTQPLLDLGLNAVLIDTPGTGCALPGVTFTGVSGLWESLRAWLPSGEDDAEAAPMLFGAGIGGAVALHMAAKHPGQFHAVAALSPPYDLQAVAGRLKPWVRAELCAFFGCADDGLEGALRMVKCVGIAKRIDCPVLIIGGGKDTDFPNKQARRLADEFGPKHTDYWGSRRASHCCYEKQPQLRLRLAQWLGKHVGSFSERSEFIDPDTEFE